MKLRIQEQDITLRLQPEEIDALSNTKKLTQSTKLPNGSIEITIEAKDVAEIDVIVAEKTFKFIFPSQLLAEWKNTSKVGYTRQYDKLAFTIEEDMPRKRKEH